jgi:transcriptional regulator NrdR family protein
MAGEIDPKGSYRFCVGMQYDRLDWYRQLRRKIPTPESPFEHMMFAAGSASSHVVDLVWVILGFDPFGFRLCRNWDGGDFAFGFVNGVLADTTTSQACSLGLLDTPLCRPNDLKAVSRERQCPSHEIGFAKYEEAFKKATYLVQKNDKHVRESIIRAAEVHGENERDVATQIRKRLRRLYPDTLEPAFSHVLEIVFDRHTRGLTSSQCRHFVLSGRREGDIDWELWLDIYRKCLDDLVSEFGLPGHIFLDNHVAEATPVRLE